MASQKIHVRSTGDGALLLECSWRLLNKPINKSLWQSLDIVLEHINSSTSAYRFDNLEGAYDIHIENENSSQSISPESFGSARAFQFFIQCLRATTASSGGLRRVVKLIVPLQKGHIVRSDIIPLRLRDYQFVETAVSFAEPLESYSGLAITPSDSSNLVALFSAAAAGLILHHDSEKESDDELEALSLAVESELENRLSFPWISSENIRRRTLVLVEGTRAHPDNGGSTAPSLYLAAAALGINMVVLDNSGHWLEGPEYAHWREAFIPTKLTDPPEEGFTDRIIKSVKTYGKPVDGIVTFCDSYATQVAQAAQQLGLQTASPDALRIATNKYLTSVFAGHQAYQASSPDEALEIVSKNNLPYPLIIKPCNGWSSEGVFRVDSLDTLTSAVKSINTSRHGSEFVIEKYCSGPEVDANFVLLDGEILFFEACDDFPKTADFNGPSVGSLNSFHELNSVYPSALPAREIDVLRNSFLDTLLKLGLQNGIMHLEGRVEYSSVDYETQDGVLDLHPRDTVSEAPEPTAWLIEINPRPLGMTGSQVIESTYGVDYWGLAMLIAVADQSRARSLSQPFKHGAQYTCVMVFIPADYPSSCQGIFDSDDICAELKARRPDLAKHISRCGCLVKRGQKVPHPSSGVNSFLAYFNVFSRNGRREALELADKVREEIRFSFI
ncbi:ATP-grasp domain-containing protein [Trichoderma breve]|uniref:ATP-grasp domain-containing protein n=1 Tax=Trichoderma breve TaxID=2034170 RepID=A0A9W9B8U3_9HYPO|nr:ATP-grasp domain-containing protein [Trichoderma breve]KAJ4858762.1 ATP-grasp domain-containing protein [Trichoderma breve]